MFLALVSLAATFGRGWIIVTQRKILERILGTTGRGMSRRSLNRHLAGLERDRVINRTRRHTRNRFTGELDLRATLYKFGELGILWIKRLRGAALIPLGRLAVPKTALSRKPYALGKRLTVDESPTARRPKSNSSAPQGAPKSAPRPPHRWRH